MLHVALVQRCTTVSIAMSTNYFSHLYVRVNVVANMKKDTSAHTAILRLTRAYFNTASLKRDIL